MKTKPFYKRVLLKLSGEALMGNQTFGVDPNTTKRIAQEINEVHSLGVEIAIVIGGGNIFRGLSVLYLIICLIYPSLVCQSLLRPT